MAGIAHAGTARLTLEVFMTSDIVVIALEYLVQIRGCKTVFAVQTANCRDSSPKGGGGRHRKRSHHKHSHN